MSLSLFFSGKKKSLSGLTLSNMSQGRFALERLSRDHLELAFPWLKGLRNKDKKAVLLQLPFQISFLPPTLKII